MRTNNQTTVDAIISIYQVSVNAAFVNTQPGSAAMTTFKGPPSKLWHPPVVRKCTENLSNILTSDFTPLVYQPWFSGWNQQNQSRSRATGTTLPPLFKWIVQIKRVISAKKPRENTQLLFIFSASTCQGRHVQPMSRQWVPFKNATHRAFKRVF